jgi:hypothetical protein
MRLPSRNWFSKLDMFSFHPSLRPSNKLSKLWTPAGVVATLVIAIMSVIFFSIRYSVLTNRLGVGFNNIIKPN